MTGVGITLRRQRASLRLFRLLCNLLNVSTSSSNRRLFVPSDSRQGHCSAAAGLRLSAFMDCRRLTSSAFSIAPFITEGSIRVLRG